MRDKEHRARAARQAGRGRRQKEWQAAEREAQGSCREKGVMKDRGKQAAGTGSQVARNQRPAHCAASRRCPPTRAATRQSQMPIVILSGSSLVSTTTPQEAGIAVSMEFRIVRPGSRGSHNSCGKPVAASCRKRKLKPKWPISSNRDE